MAELLDAAGLVGKIYDASLDASRWLDFLVPFSVRLQSHVGMIWAHNFDAQTVEVQGIANGSGRPTEDIFTCWGLDPAALESFAAYYCRRNVWLENTDLHKEGRVVHGGMLFPQSRLKSTEYWGDWLRPQDIFYTAAAIVEKREQRSVNVTVCRPESAGPYSADDLALISQLMPHLQAGFALHRRLYRAEALSHASTGVLESVPFGTLLLDHAGCLLHANGRAHQLAAACRMLRLRDGAALQCTLAADDAVLQRLVHQATGTGATGVGSSGGALRLHGFGGEQLQLLVAPLPSWSSPFGQRTAAAVFLSDPTAHVGSLATALRGIYRMSPAEARLTEALVNGRTLQEYAETAGLSINTVRTQVRHAAAKAGSSRQTDLVRTVLTGPAVLSRGA